MSLRVTVFFCNTESKMFQQVKDCRPIEMKYWKKVLFNHASKTGHEIIITETFAPGTKDKKGMQEETGSSEQEQGKKNE